MLKSIEHCSFNLNVVDKKLTAHYHIIFFIRVTQFSFVDHVVFFIRMTQFILEYSNIRIPKTYSVTVLDIFFDIFDVKNVLI